MCLAVPGKVIEINSRGALKMGKVNFGGIQKQICLEWTPDVRVGDYVIVHVGFAISVLDEQEALQTLEIFKQMDTLDDELTSYDNQ